jgi:hypothetical protein
VWSTSTWIPTTTGTYPYTIYAVDAFGNTNTTAGSIEVIDGFIPTITISSVSSNVDAIEIGQNVSIQVNATDFSGINQVVLHVDGLNISLNFDENTTWFIENLIFNSTGLFVLEIYAEDNAGNWNSTELGVTVVDTTNPTLISVLKNYNTIEVGENATIWVEVLDNYFISTVMVDFSIVSYSFTEIEVNQWQFVWTSTEVGRFPFTIVISDAVNNTIEYYDSFTVIDSILPVIINYELSDNIIGLSENIEISLIAEDNSGIENVTILIANRMFLFSTQDNHTFAFEDWGTKIPGTYHFIIAIQDYYGNTNIIEGIIEVKANNYDDSLGNANNQTLALNISIPSLSIISVFAVGSIIFKKRKKTIQKRWEVLR